MKALKNCKKFLDLVAILLFYNNLQVLFCRFNYVVKKEVNVTKHKKYVVHYCKYPKCNNAWIDEDLTNAQSRPPKWKNCKSCSEVLGIDFDAQIRPQKKLSEKQKEVLQKKQIS